MTRIHIELDVTSRYHTDEVLEVIRVELRKRALGFVFEAIDSAKLADGPVHRSGFHVAGDITLED